MWSASVVFLAVATIAFLIALVSAAWARESPSTCFGWAGLFFLAFALLVQAAHSFGWA